MAAFGLAQTPTPVWAQAGIPFYADDGDVKEPKEKKKPRRKRRRWLDNTKDEADSKSEVDTKDEPATELQEDLEPPSPVAGIPENALREIWEQRRKALDAGNQAKAQEHLDELLRKKAMSGWPNVAAYALALVEEASTLQSLGKSLAAVQRAQAAVDMAPNLPEARLMLAKAQSQSVMGILSSPGELWAHTKIHVHEAPLLYQHLSHGGLGILVATLLVGFVFFAFAAVRYGGLMLFDLSILTRRAAARWQLLLLLCSLLLLPVLLRLGWAGVLLCWLAIFLVHYRGSERWGAINLAVVLGMFPLMLSLATASFEYTDSNAHDLYRAARDMDDMGAEQRIQAKQQKSPYDHYALGLRARWRGELEKAKEHLEAAAKGIESSALYTELGNVHASLPKKDTTSAIKYYKLAIAAQPNSVEARFNLSQVYYSIADNRSGGEQHRMAQSIDTDLVEGYSKTARKAGPRFVVHVEPDRRLLRRPVTPTRVGMEARSSLWGMLAGPLSTTVYFGLAGFLALLLLVGRGLQTKLEPAVACEQCGRPASRWVAKEMPNQKHCQQCYHAFVANDAEKQSRIQKEIQIRRFAGRQEKVLRVLRVLLPGGCQLFLGHAARGLPLLALGVFAVVGVFVFAGLLPEAYPVDAVFRVLLIVTFAGLGVLAYVVGFWDSARELD